MHGDTHRTALRVISFGNWNNPYGRTNTIERVCARLPPEVVTGGEMTTDSPLTLVDELRPSLLPSRVLHTAAQSILIGTIIE